MSILRRYLHTMARRMRDTVQQFPDWLVWESAVAPEICDEIIKACLELPSKNATTFRAGEDPIHEDPNRKTQIRWVPKDDEHGWINQIFENYAKEANEHFNMDLSYLPELQFTEYKDIGYHYGWHHDIDWSNQHGTHRKISLVLQLTDPEEYQGGDFKFKYIENPNPDTVKKRGTMIAFLSYQEHCVEPILGGGRTSLVGWYRGPRFR